MTADFSLAPVIFSRTLRTTSDLMIFPSHILQLEVVALDEAVFVQPSTLQMKGR
jgi:hypothetical protein